MKSYVNVYTNFSPASVFLVLFPLLTALFSYSFSVPVGLVIIFEEIFSTRRGSNIKKCSLRLEI